MTDADVLLVEDAPEFAQLAQLILGDAGLRVRTVGTMGEAISEIALSVPDVVVLDLNLPDGDGLDLCRSIRSHSNAYIIVVSGRARKGDRLEAFAAGADDFLVKPFAPRELAARVEALLRRPRSEVAEGLPRVFGNLVIDPNAREVSLHGRRIELTRIEFDLLETMSGSPKSVFTRQQLLDRVWGPGWFGDDHVVDVHVANLRKKVDVAGEKSWVRTVRGVGYSMAT